MGKIFSSKGPLFLIFLAVGLMLAAGAAQDRRTDRAVAAPAFDSSAAARDGARPGASVELLARRLRIFRKAGNVAAAARIFALLFPSDAAAGLVPVEKAVDAAAAQPPAATPLPKSSPSSASDREIPVMNSGADERAPSIEMLPGTSGAAPLFVAAEQWAGGGPDVIRVSKSSDSGATWTETAVFGGGRPATQPRLRQVSRDALGLIFVSQWTASDRDIKFARLSPGLGLEALTSVEAGLADQASPSLVSDLAAFSAPYLYAAYAERRGTYHAIKVRVSQDLGATWGRGRTVASFTAPEDFDAGTSIAFDPAGGRLYVAYVGWRGGAAGIAVACSATFGASWTSPVFVTAPGVFSDLAPAIAVAGRTVLVAYEHTVSGADRDIRFAWSIDDGVSWLTNGRLAEGPSDDRFPDVGISEASGSVRILASYVRDGVRVIVRDCALSNPSAWSAEKDVKTDTKAIDNGGAALLADAGPAGRSAPIVAWAERDPDYDVVVPAPGLEVTPSNREVGSGEGTTTFDVANAGSGRMDWTAEVTAGGDWLTIVSGASGTNAGTITAGFTANADLTSRVGTITVTAPGANGSPTDVTVTQAGGPRLSLTPAQGLVSSGPQGGPFTPLSMTYTLENTGVSSLNWTATATQAWLDVSPEGGALNPGESALVMVSLNTGANALTPETYVDSVTFTNTINGDGTTARSVSLTVTEPPGTLSVAPAAGLDASGTQGGPFSPASVTYTLTNVGTSAIDWTAEKSQPWVALSASGGALEPGGSTTVTVSIDSGADALTPNTYNDTVTFTNTTNGRGTTTRPVALTVNAPPGALSVTPAGGLSSSGIQGGPFSPAGITYTLQNTGGVAIDWTAAKIQPWLTLSSAGGALAAGATTTVTVSINGAADALAPDMYNDTVTFTNTTNGSGDTTRPVALTVNASPGALSVSPAGGLSSSGVQGGPFSPASITYTLQNTGGVAIDWTAAKTQPWVTLSSVGGTLTAEATTTVTVSINGAADALAPDTYNDTVTFTNTTNGSGNTSRSVALTVNPQPAALSVTPTGGLISFGAQGGPFTPASKTFTLQNTGGVSLNWTASKTQAWVTLSATSGTLTAGATIAVIVSINSAAAALPADTYADAVSFTNTTNGSGTTTRPVTLTVGPMLELALSARRLVEKAWIISREYAQLNLVVTNPSAVPIQSFVVYKKSGDGAFQALLTVPASSVQNGAWTFNDTFLEPGLSYTYRVAALDALGKVVVESGAVTI